MAENIGFLLHRYLYDVKRLIFSVKYLCDMFKVYLRVKQPFLWVSGIIDLVHFELSYPCLMK